MAVPLTFGGDQGRRPWMRALVRGAAKRCPQCGVGRLFRGYTRTAPACETCGLDLTGHQADDAPPYVTMLIVGHLMIPLALAVRQIFEPSLALQFMIWLPLILGAALFVLPISKGALVGIQWANRMHGFGDGREDKPVAP